MKEKRTHVTRKRSFICLMLIATLTMLHSTTVFAKDVVYDLSDMVGNSEPVFVLSGDIIRNDDGGGLRVRYEVSESSRDIFPGTQALYNTYPHVVHEYEIDGVAYTRWRVKAAGYGDDIVNLILIPANNDSSNYTGYMHSWKYDGDHEEPCVITIKNSVEPENCYANFENGKRKYKVIIDEGTDRAQKLEEDEDYGAYSGSTIIEIEARIIQGLPEGNHTVTVYFYDGRCKVNFVKGPDEAHSAGSQPMNAITQTSQQNATVNQNGIKKAPKTGEI